jgi:ankyrin repeat protein
VDLFAAIAAGDDQRVRELIGADRDVLDARDERGLSPVLAAKYVGQNRIADVLADAGTVNVFDAAATGRAEELRAILRQLPASAALRSSDGFTALHYAAFFADGPTVAVLLEAGADPSAVAENPMRVQPLHSAAASRNLEGARHLLAAGADPNAEQQDGFLPLDAAVQNDDRELQELLRAHGARTSR